MLVPWMVASHESLVKLASSIQPVWCEPIDCSLLPRTARVDQDMGIAHAGNRVQRRCISAIYSIKQERRDRMCERCVLDMGVKRKPNWTGPAYTSESTATRGSHMIVFQYGFLQLRGLSICLEDARNFSQDAVSPYSCPTGSTSSTCIRQDTCTTDYCESLLQ